MAEFVRPSPEAHFDKTWNGPMHPAEWFSRRRDTSAPVDGPAPRDAAEALAALNATIRKHGCDGSDADSLRTPVLTYCRFARAENLPPEHMLIGLKHALDDALVAVGDDPIRRAETRTRVVKLAIDAYYGGRP